MAEAHVGRNGSKTPQKSATVGPITRQEEAYNWLRETKVPELFRSLIAGLMVETPEDPHKYLNSRLEEIKIRGMSNIDWESFVYDLHPTRVKPRAQLVQDSTTPEEKKDMPPFADSDDYEPQLFRLTEATD